MQFKQEDINRLKVKEWKIIDNFNTNKEIESGMAILTSNTIDFKAKNIIKDKEVNFRVIKWSLY